ncbi:MAG: hypothetical protein NC131_18670 [Roseburia sp.]|nr:hypothetical protein [Roseburia sp.]
MFGKKKTTTPIDFDEKLKSAKYECIYQTLKDILKTEIKTADDKGKETTDYAAMCAAIKTKARIAVDFVADLEKSGEND